MDFLAEDVTYLVVGLGVLAAIFLIALKVTQQGKYLIWAGAVLAAALAAIVVEQLWVTNSERIEQVVYQLRDAVVASDAPAVLALLTPDVEYEQRGSSLQGDAARAFVESQLELTHFDFVRITHLEAQAGDQSGRGSALFRILTSGSYQSGVTMNFGSVNLDFSLGFRETAPQVWKVDRVTLTRSPREMPSPGGALFRDRSRFSRDRRY